MKKVLVIIALCVGFMYCNPAQEGNQTNVDSTNMMSDSGSMNSGRMMTDSM